MISSENFSTARVIGYFSLPSLHLAEVNPDAYNQAMAALPPNCGCCQHCGAAIIHHVVVKLSDGRSVFIGTTCAEKVGDEIAHCVREKLTTEQRAEKLMHIQSAQSAASRVATIAAEIEREARAANEQKFSDILTALRAQQTEFHSSLANQLVSTGSLSLKQQNYVVKAMFGRRNKKNAEAYDAIYDRLDGN